MNDLLPYSRVHKLFVSLLILSYLSRSTHGFSSPSSSFIVRTYTSISTKTDSKLFSTPYRTVEGGSGPTLRDTPYGQRWEGRVPSFQERFQEQKRRQQQQLQQPPPPPPETPYMTPPTSPFGETMNRNNNNNNYFGNFQNNMERERDPMPQFPRGPLPASPLTRYADRYSSGRTGPPPPPPREVGEGPLMEQPHPFYASQPPPQEQPLAAFQTPNPPTFMPMNSKEIQGGSRGTWVAHDTLEHDEVTIKLTTPDGRPLKADVEVYNGPSNTPQKMRIYSEDGQRRPFTAMIATPSGATKTHALIKEWESPMSAIRGPVGGTTSHSISVKNIGPIEFPLIAGVEGGGTVPDVERAARMSDYAGRRSSFFMRKKLEIHGGHLQTYPFDPSVASVQVEIHSQGLPIMAVVELWNGPGDVKTVAQVYNDDGQTKPFKCIIETPGGGNVIAIRNVGPTAYPFEVELDVVAFDDAAYSYSYQPQQEGMGGGGGPRY